MDAQMEFLMLWASTCQPMVEWVIENRPKHTREHFYGLWAKKNATWIDENPVDEAWDATELFAHDIVGVAALYVDLMIRWGCFDDD